MAHYSSDPQKRATMIVSQCSVILAVLCLSLENVGAFVPLQGGTVREHAALFAKAAAKKKKSGGGGGVAGVKGFGGASSSSKKAGGVNMDRSKDALAFYDFLENNGAGDNLKRAALGYFPLPGGGDEQLRGVVALKDMKKGDVLIRIPYEIAMNLGLEGADPTLPGMTLLEAHCKVLAPDAQQGDGPDRSAYHTMLPEYMGTDCLGSTDFFSDEALEALQAPMVVEETLKRGVRTKTRFEQEVDYSFPTWIDGTPVTEQHLRWAVWLITSRILTVEGDAEENRAYRLLIPFLDMCNHDRSSPHVLTGRAVPGGELKVVAGAPVQAGEQINICYGGGVAGNDRFLQDYGFLDSTVAYNIVAQQLLGKKRMLEGDSAGRTMSIIDRDATMEKLRQTTMKQDEELLEKETDSSLRSAIQYRLGVKKALSKFIIME
jgi:hypothetical protein